MKKNCIIFLLSIIITIAAYGLYGRQIYGDDVTTTNNQDMIQTTAQTTDFFRIHIRADSNERGAQDVKYCIKDAVVNYLTPIVANCINKEQAQVEIEKNLSQIESIANAVLRERGFSYSAAARVKREQFPTRIYNGYTLPSGVYTSLIVTLGSGQGDNWWCVIYPPLCFTSPTGQNVKYKSKILEIIQLWESRFFKKA